jgi:cytochrome c biogenesis protein CcmG/thiol:disulfide interchange protein DsbE
MEVVETPVGEPEVAPPSPRRGRTAVAVTVVIAVVVGLFIAVLATREPAQNRRVSSPLVGLPAPGIVGTTLTGSSFDLGRQQGRWVLVNFFATWCVPCRDEQPELVQFQEEHKALGDASVVSVIYDDESGAATDFFERTGGTWPVVLDPDSQLAVNYGVAAVPESYLVAPDGTVVAKLIGGVTRAGLNKIMAQLTGAAP